MLQKLPQAILFDLDATLIDSGHLWMEANQESARMLHIKFTQDEEIALHGQSFLDILRTKKIKEVIIDKIFEMREKLLVAKLDNVTFLPGAKELLEFTQEHFPTAIVTNGHNIAVDVVKNRLKIDTLVDEIITWDDVQPKIKPHPYPIQLACKKLGIAVEDAIFIGDHLNDVLAGERANTATFLLKNNHNKNMKHPRCITSLDEKRALLRKLLTLEELQQPKKQRRKIHHEH